MCLSQNLSLSLKKTLFCPERIEFVGHDVYENENRPAQSKHSLLKTWPEFKIARDVASFLGFMNFYSLYIPYFEQRAAPLRPLAKLEMDEEIKSRITPEIANARKDLINAILDDPCVGRFNHKKKSYLLTDASKLGYGYNPCQPNDDPVSIAAMEREMNGGNVNSREKNPKPPCDPVVLNPEN